MSKAAWVRLSIGLAGGAAAMWAFVAISSPWIAIPATVAAFCIGSVAAERVYRALASLDEQRRDLEDRARNSPD